jgi:hypothetical protein
LIDSIRAIAARVGFGCIGSDVMKNPSSYVMEYTQHESVKGKETGLAVWGRWLGNASVVSFGITVALCVVLGLCLTSFKSPIGILLVAIVYGIPWILVSGGIALVALIMRAKSAAPIQLHTVLLTILAAFVAVLALGA